MCAMATTTDTAAADNPLLDYRDLPDFAAVEARHVEPAVRGMLEQQRVAIERLEAAGDPTIEWVMGLEEVRERLHDVWGPVSHLNAVVSTPQLREAFNCCLPLVTEFDTDLGQNERLYAHFVTLERGVAPQLAVVREVVRQNLRDFRLAGVALQGEPKRRFRDLISSLAARQAAFEQNLMDATDDFSHHETDAGALAGLPALLRERARAAAAEKGLDGWLLALDPPTYQAVVTHAESRGLRARFYRAWVTRASDLGPRPEHWDNGPLIDEILRLRHEAAELLGFRNFAELSLATKMAGSTEEVLAFLDDLAVRVKGVAEREVAMLTNFAGHALEAWDIAFYSERLKQRTLQIAEEELRAYFPLPRVLEGLFELAQRLFSITISQTDSGPFWHPSVRHYRIQRRDGGEVGGFLTDLFARPNKRGGAWMDGCTNRARLPSRIRNPLAYLVCNFTPPIGEDPSLLTHSDVVTLFHEFGHALHHLLTEVDYPSVAGINGVAWDAVELPSQFMENYAWLPEVLTRISAHHRSGEPLPADKIDTLNRSRTFLSGLAIVRQLEFALFDFRLHSAAAAQSGEQVMRILREVRDKVAVVTSPSYNRFPSSFSHVFGGGYAAGYYSYKWAEVLAADAFAAFTEAGAFDPDTAERFRRSILAVGGSRTALEAFIDFRGRPPALEPLLRQAGIDL
jgi:oligopeptidase A